MTVHLSYRTKSPKPLKNLQKVYFCSADPDQETYYETLFEDLFSVQPDIALWYPVYDGSEISQEEEEAFLADLSEMNLFVIPVTEVFLKTENRARKVEFPFAEEHHIPILPILQEPGLENLFNQNCGTLQCLNKYDPDPTALPYKDKLKLFLDSVILKDEIIQSIRQAFAAYIFLSYRKKDRKYAQEVMRVIHQYPYTRDIAVWYDEFLTPGEDFNESIRQAFEKSDLFSVVVTPHLLENPNYVMTVEYPMAVECGKTILPLMAVPADLKELERYYPNISKTLLTAEIGSKQIESFIRQALTVKENDDPKHLYFMGLAYLSGIDVETDHEKARNLITDAAKGGTDAAFVRLVTMYETGQGVKRNYETAAEWQNRYVSHLEEKLRAKENDPELRFEYIRACSHACDKYIRLNRYEDGWRMINKVMGIDPKDVSGHEVYALMDALRYASRLAVLEKNYEKAVQLLGKMIELTKSPNIKHGEKTALLWNGLAEDELGEILQKAKDPVGAEEHFKKAVPLLKEAEDLEKMAGTENVSGRTLISCYGSLAYLLWQKSGNDPEKLSEAENFAKLALEQADALKERGYAFDEEAYTIRARLAEMQILKNQGHLEKADAIAAELITMAEERFRKEESNDASRHLSGAYVFRSDVKRAMKDPEEEARLLEQAVELEEALGAKIELFVVAPQLRVYYWNLARNAKEQDKPEQFAKNVERLEKLAEQCYSKDPSLYWDLGNVYGMYTDPDSLIRSYECFETACDGGPVSKKTEDSRKKAEQKLTESFIQLGKDGNTETLKNAFEHFQSCSMTVPSSEGFIRIRDRAESDLAFALSKKEDIPSKEKACEYYEDLAKKYPEKDIYRENLRLIRSQIAMRYYRDAEKGNIEAARNALEIYTELAEAYPEKDYRKNANYIQSHFLPKDSGI